jgi:hypothetical protein
MTEAEWQACDEPLRMLTFVSASISLRKRRLFAAAGARRVWGLLGDARSREAVEAGERFADGAATLEELAVAAESADEVQYEIWERAGGGTRFQTDLPDEWCAALWAKWAASDPSEVDVLREKEDLSKHGLSPAAQADLLRELVRHPGSAAGGRIEAGPDVGRLARHAYEAREWAVLAVLADALEEGGYTDAALLSHLRSPGPHVRGCWALDLVLGKE